MGAAANWTHEQTVYLQENWGTVSIPTLAKNLRRSEQAIILRASRMKLGAFLENGDYVTLNQLLIAVTGSKSCYSYKTTSWVQERGLPVHSKRVKNNSFKVVYIDEFWKWAEKNKDFLDLSKMEENAIGAEPQWVNQQRRLHYEKNSKYKFSPWSKLEDEHLIQLLKLHKHTYFELTRILGRTSGAIQRRCCDLKIKERPVKANNRNLWSEGDFASLASCIQRGMSYELIAEVIGRSGKAIRGKIGAIYYTENLDKVRKMLKNGKWGTGAPVPTVNNYRRKSQVKGELSKLAGLLALRRNELGWSPYWQKDMCLHWDDMKGCTKEQENCDVCACFQRIPPQYCVRCGATFFERQPCKICSRCRQARLKQAQMKWARMDRRKNNGGEQLADEHYQDGIKVSGG